MKHVHFGIVVFPGSNCDHDAYHATKHVLGEDATFLWHKSSDLCGVDVVVLPGGFSYGDYLRCGSIARFSPIMKEVTAFARDGGLVIGICNGFQILAESGLLPGALLRNESLRFVCRNVTLRVERDDTPFTNALHTGDLITMPVAHGEGNYYTDPGTLDELERSGRVLFRYADADGALTEDANPNGSLSNIAGIVNETATVLGMMPHPERNVETILGDGSGLGIFRSLVDHIHSGTPAFA
jgi:phosphoribosylformylglycinamidine synthase subunit PurQ / glutaminase